MINETIKLQGDLVITVTDKDGKVKERREEKNLFPITLNYLPHMCPNTMTIRTYYLTFSYFFINLLLR